MDVGEGGDVGVGVLQEIRTCMNPCYSANPDPSEMLDPYPDFYLKTSSKGSKWSHEGPWTLTLEAWRLKIQINVCRFLSL
jgi:hypothetical protein